MKVKKPFILLAAIVLVACSSNANLASSSLENSTSSLEPEVTSSEDANTSESSNEETSTSSEATSASSNEDSGSTSSDNTLKKTVTFYNGGFKSSSLNQATAQTNFVQWFNGDDDVLNTIGYEGLVQINEIDDDKNYTLILGSRNSDGKLTFNFKVSVLSVKAVVQPYTKYIAYNNTYNNDKEAKFYIDTSEYDLSLDSAYSGPTDNRTIEKTFEEAKRSFSISNKGNNQRVFVHSMEITYIA